MNVSSPHHHAILRCDASRLIGALELAKTLPEGLQLGFDLFEISQETCLVDADLASTASASEVIVRLDPSDRLLGLVSRGARNVD